MNILTDEEIGKLSASCIGPSWCYDLVRKVEAAVMSKLAEQTGDPCLWTTRAMIGTSTMQDENYPVPLYTEAQLIAAQQRTADACAKAVAAEHLEEPAQTDGDAAYEAAIDHAIAAIRNGEWREYL